jgi:hypothetical protein
MQESRIHCKGAFPFFANIRLIKLVKPLSIWNHHLHHNVLFQLVNLTKLFKLLQNTTGEELYPAEKHHNL